MLHKFGFITLCTLLPLLSLAQKYSGQWSGSFDEKTMPGYKTEYVLEIEASGKTFEGSSITYFIIGGKRYYTICRITGTIDPLSKTLVSTEVERIKANTPPDFKDCFQIHTLTYFKKDSVEQLIGTWKPAKPSPGCNGSGTTVLERKILVRKNTIPVAQKATPSAKPAAPKPATAPSKNNPVAAKQSNTKSQPPQATQKPVSAAPKAIAHSTQSSTSKITNDKSAPTLLSVESRKSLQQQRDTASALITKPITSLEKRENKLYETIVLTEPEIEVNLYDNAEVDGDVVTVLFNDEVVVSSKVLSDKPITLKLRAVPGKENLLVMYAENLGRIPPNTAIMRIRNGNNYYKILLSADDKRNASVAFKLQ